MDKIDPREELEELGYDIIYKPHEEVVDHMAFYWVEYEGKEIKCGIVDSYDIEMNEVWLSEKLRPYEKYILFHELNEIKYRAEGMEDWESHQKALEKDKIWEEDEKWQELRREINLVTEERVTKLEGFDSELFQIIMDNRPYFSMENLKDVEGLDEERYNILKKEFWCL